MRIHRLEIQAFGPFAGRETVDFDRLSGHGLFLLNGPTGAGKTSILDAVCYALYGVVPGARQDGKRLRSDHAAPGTAPEVVCEFTAAGRRFEVTRSPQYSRPSKRGSGTTSEQARTLLREYVNGAWVEKSARNDEAAAEIKELLGMNQQQFTRVVMLPQGDFAAFLRSDAKSRRDLLQQLFNTDRFEGIERQLLEEATAARQDWQEQEQELNRVLRQLTDLALAHREDPEEPMAAGTDSEVGTGTDPEARTGTDAEVGTGTGTGPGPGAEAETALDPELVVQELRRSADSAAVETESRRMQLGEAHSAERELRARADRHVKLAGLRRREADYEAGSAESDNTAVKLASHRRAEVVAPSVLAVRQARAAADKCGASAQSRWVALSLHPLWTNKADTDRTELCKTDTDRTDVCRADTHGIDADTAAWTGTGAAVNDSSNAMLAVALRQAGAALGALEAALPEERKLAGLNTEQRALVKRLEGTRQQRNLVKADLVEVRSLHDAAEREAETEGIEAAQVVQWETRLEDARQQQSVISAYADAQNVRGGLEAEHAQARTAALDSRTVCLDLMQQRLDQAAAELASTLAPGVECPVCGSAEHPSPAQSAAAGLVTREDEVHARKEQTNAESRLEAVAARLAAAREDMSALAARGGEASPAESTTALKEAETELARCRVAAGKHSLLEQRISELDARITSLAAEDVEAERSLRDGTVRLEHLGHSIAELDARLLALRHSHTTLAARHQELNEYRDLLEQVRDTSAATASAQERVDHALAALAVGLQKAGFASAEAVEAALLDDGRRARCEAAADVRLREGHEIEALRGAPDVTTAGLEEAKGIVAPSAECLAAQSVAVEQTDAAATEAGVKEGLLHRAVVQAEAHAEEYTRILAHSGPLKDRWEVLGPLAETVRGGGDNDYRMTLSTYVLAARLEQVALAATERLAAMTDGRYALVHSDARSGNKKSGLGLHVTDEWTGHSRDTATLSGGESFMASLALALGLADVVQQESGGLHIETLFVDEGFGSLDEQSLEQVMDALEGLRDGGRVVGLVSHVAEMKQRIPAQLEVVKERNGSSIRYREVLV